MAEQFPMNHSVFETQADQLPVPRPAALHGRRPSYRLENVISLEDLASEIHTDEGLTDLRDVRAVQELEHGGAVAVPVDFIAPVLDVLFFAGRRREQELQLPVVVKVGHGEFPVLRDSFFDGHIFFPDLVLRRKDVKLPLFVRRHRLRRAADGNARCQCER